MCCCSSAVTVTCSWNEFTVVCGAVEVPFLSRAGRNWCCLISCIKVGVQSAAIIVGSTCNVVDGRVPRTGGKVP